MNGEGIRHQLQSMRDELVATLHGIRSEVMTAKGRVAEDDQAVLEHEEFISIRRNSLNHNTLILVNEAIERLDAGDYGICHACEEPISEKRLKVLPWAKYCVPCQERISLTQPDMTVVGAAALEPVEHALT
jgi:DnaK suppressor protein